MAMIEEMEATGTWLFRWRSYLPLVMVVLLFTGLEHFAYPFGSHRWDQAWELLCLAISFAGLLVRVLTVGFAPKKTSGRNTRKQVADSLNTTGMYSVVRNPLYLGNFLAGLGPAMFLRVWWVPTIYMLVFMLYYERIIFAEEMFLRQKFGQLYAEWAEKTPAFVPRLRQWLPSPLLFNWRQVLRREHQTLMGIVAAFFVLELACLWRLGLALLDDTMWNAIAGATLLCFLVIRVLRKFTKALTDMETNTANNVPEDTARKHAARQRHVR
ncbi:MAG: hypothetical protein HYV36_03095 [Lentisphaerae bacterium]|nr:hypothetical protein [Lentisphaerota bacterium]